MRDRVIGSCIYFRSLREREKKKIYINKKIKIKKRNRRLNNIGVIVVFFFKKKKNHSYNSL